MIQGKDNWRHHKDNEKTKRTLKWCKNGWTISKGKRHDLSEQTFNQSRIIKVLMLMLKDGIYMHIKMQDRMSHTKSRKTMKKHIKLPRWLFHEIKPNDIVDTQSLQLQDDIWEVAPLDLWLRRILKFLKFMLWIQTKALSRSFATCTSTAVRN